MSLHLPFGIWYDAHAFQTRTAPNRAIHHLTSNTDPLKTWYGAVIVLKFTGIRCLGFRDVLPADIWTLSSFFMSVPEHIGLQI